MSKTKLSNIETLDIIGFSKKHNVDFQTSKTIKLLRRGKSSTPSLEDLKQAKKRINKAIEREQERRELLRKANQPTGLNWQDVAFRESIKSFTSGTGKRMHPEHEASYTHSFKARQGYQNGAGVKILKHCDTCNKETESFLKTSHATGSSRLLCKNCGTLK